MTRMRTLMMVVLLGLVSTLALAIEPFPFKDTAQRERFQELTSELRCMVCQNESLAASNADLASDMRQKIFAMMQAGKTDAEIKQYLVARYSSFVLYDPPLKPGTWLLWFGPGLILLVGGVGLAVFLKRRARGDAPAAVSGDDNW